MDKGKKKVIGVVLSTYYQVGDNKFAQIYRTVPLEFLDDGRDWHVVGESYDFFKGGGYDNMNPLISINVVLHFEVKDSEMYGGAGSIGYVAINLKGFKDINKITDEYIEAQTQKTADFLRVPRSSVRLISKEEFDLETDDEDDNFEHEDDLE